MEMNCPFRSPASLTALIGSLNLPGSSTTERYDGRTLDARNPETIRALMPFWEWFYRDYFRVKTDGWHHIPKTGKVLLVGSHNGGLAAPDMVMMMYDWFRQFGPERLVYGLMHPTAWQAYPMLAKLAAETGAVLAEPQMALKALHRGASVLVYPGGAQDVFRPYSQRKQICFAGRRGFIKLALRESVPIIPVIAKGAHETLVVLTDIYDFMQQLHQWGMPWLQGIDPQVFPIYLGLPWGLSFGPLPNFPLPSSIHTRVCPPIVFEKYGREAVRDRAYVDDCYDLVRDRMQQSLDELYAEWD